MKTVRNRSSVPAAPTNRPDDGAVGKRRRILHSAIDKVYAWANLSKASHKVARNKGCAGVDGETVEAWMAKEKQHLNQLRRRLYEDTYRSKPALRRYIEKPGSTKKRPLGIPAVVDRVCQQAVQNVLSPVFEEYLHEDCYGYRPGRSQKQAAKRIEQLRKQGLRHVVDLDIKGFFDNVDHEILMGLVGRVVKDRRVLGLIRGWLKAGVMEEGKKRYETSGTPQGGVISPLLANVYLTPLDEALTGAGYHFVRYADDVIIACRSKEDAETALKCVRTTLGRLRLELNEEKTRIGSFDEGFDFLGYRFKRRSRQIAEKSLQALCRTVREITKRQQGDVPVTKVIANLTPALRGWGEYQREGRNVGIFTSLDSWIRKRLRGYVYRRWRDFRGPEEPKPTRKDFEQMGLFSLRKILRPNTLQTELFPVPQ
jgi:group II intron reverse transcriptase/maturase